MKSFLDIVDINNLHTMYYSMSYISSNASLIIRLLIEFNMYIIELIGFNLYYFEKFQCAIIKLI